jgi:hypothetical protein
MLLQEFLSSPIEYRVYSSIKRSELFVCGWAHPPPPSTDLQIFGRKKSSATKISLEENHWAAEELLNFNILLLKIRGNMTF